MALRPALALHEAFSDVDFRAPLPDSREGGTRRGTGALRLGTRRRDRSSVPAFQGAAALIPTQE